MIYQKDLKKNKVITNPENFNISNFIPSGLELLIHSFVPDSHFVLGVSYGGGDSQICISGHPKTNETELEGLSREVLEELSLEVNLEKVKKMGKLERNVFFHISLENTKIRICESKNLEKDNYERCVVCVSGEKEKILEYLEKVSYGKENEDEISGIWCCEKEKILEYLREKRKEILFY